MARRVAVGSPSGRRRVVVGSAGGRSRVVNSVSMGEAAKPLLFECVQAGCHVVLRGRRGTLWHSNLFDDVSKVSKLEDASHEMLVLLIPRVSSRVSGFPVASPCLLGKLQKPILFEGVQAGCHVVLRGRRGTLWHSNLFDNVSKVSKLEDVSHEMLVLLRPRVSSRVSGFPVASPCLSGKLQKNISFSKVSSRLSCQFVVQSRTGKCFVQAL